MIRSAVDADLPATARLAATCFGSFSAPESDAMWQSMIADNGAIVATDGAQIVGISMYLDLELTVPGGAILPAAGVAQVAVSPTHRRQGILRAMLGELHERMGRDGYPVAGLLASEGGIYGRFGYGPATVETQLRVQRRWARFHPSAPDPGGVTIVDPAEHRSELADIYDRWRRRTPGGLHTPPQMWDEVLADRESGRGEGARFALLHPDGFALYRVHKATDSVEITKLAAVTADAHAALWRVLLGLDLIDTVAIRTHLAEPLPYLLADPRRLETLSAEDALWLRILDIPAALQARRYEADLRAVIEVTGTADGSARFDLTIEDGAARVTPTAHAPDLHLDLPVLGSIYLGGHRPSAFAAANRLGCNDAQLLRQLDLAFGSDIPASLGYHF